MNAIKVDDAQRIRIPELRPGDYYEPEIHSEDKITLRRVGPPPQPLSKEQVIRAIETSNLTFGRTWEEMRSDTRRRDQPHIPEAN